MGQKMLPACRKWDVWCLNLPFDPEVWAAAMPGADESAAAAMPGSGGSVAASMPNVSESAIVARQNAGEEGAGLLQCRVPARIGVLQCRTPPRSAGAFSRRGSSSELTGGVQAVDEFAAAVGGSRRRGAAPGRPGPPSRRACHSSRGIQRWGIPVWDPSQSTRRAW